MPINSSFLVIIILFLIGKKVAFNLEDQRHCL